MTDTPAPTPPAPAEPAWLTEVRLRAGRRALWLRSLWADSRYPGEEAMAISHSEVDRTMMPVGDLALAERRFYREDPTAAVISESISQLLATGPDLRWDQLTSTLGLSTPEANLLALALAAEAAPEMRRVYGYLSDEMGPADASLPLARVLWDWPPDTRIDARSALLRWRLAWPRDASRDPGAAEGQWNADPLLLAELIGDGTPSGPLGHRVEPACGPVLYPAALNEIVAFAGALSAAGELGHQAAIEVELAGPAGSGKTLLAAQACQKLGKSLVSVDAATLAGDPAPAVAAVREVRQARLHGTVLT